MLEDTLKTPHRLVGMIQPVAVPEGKRGRQAARLHQIGCAGRVTALQETEDGRYLITLSGVSRFRIGRAAGRVRALPAGAGATGRASSATSGGPRSDPDFDRPAFLGCWRGSSTRAQLSSDWDSLKEADAGAPGQLAVDPLPVRPGGEAGAARGADARQPARDAGDADGVRAALERRRGGDAVSDGRAGRRRRRRPSTGGCWSSWSAR